MNGPKILKAMWFTWVVVSSFLLGYTCPLGRQNTDCCHGGIEMGFMEGGIYLTGDPNLPDLEIKFAAAQGIPPGVEITFGEDWEDDLIPLSVEPSHPIEGHLIWIKKTKCRKGYMKCYNGKKWIVLEQ